MRVSIRNRVWLSVIVRGSIRRWSWVRNQPLKVGRPFLVGRLGRDRPRRRIERPASALDRFNEPGPLKNVADRRSCRPILVRGPRRELRQKLARAEMGKSPPQRHDLPCDRLRRAMRTGARRVRTIEEPVRRAARPPSPPSIKRVPAHPIAPTQIRHAPMARVVIRQHPNPLLHPTSLRKRHRKSSFRPSLTCQPSTQSKLSAIYPVHTMARPPTLARPHKGLPYSHKSFLRRVARGWRASPFSAKRGRGRGAPDGVWRAGAARCKFALSVLQSDLRRGSGPHPIRRHSPSNDGRLSTPFCGTFPSKLGKRSARPWKCVNSVAQGGRGRAYTAGAFVLPVSFFFAQRGNLANVGSPTASGLLPALAVVHKRWERARGSRSPPAISAAQAFLWKTFFAGISLQ